MEADVEAGVEADVEADVEPVWIDLCLLHLPGQPVSVCMLHTTVWFAAIAFAPSSSDASTHAHGQTESHHQSL